MSANEQLIRAFYEAFQKKDYKTMQNCYSDKAVFNDAVFKELNAAQVRKMWEMLIRKSTDLELEFKNIRADENHGSAEWTASYTFSKTKRKVINRIKASFIFDDGKILRHTDSFDFYSWAKQALGITGVLLGRTSFLQNKVRKTAKGNLDEYMANN